LVDDFWEPKFLATEQTEPICRLKPYAHSEVLMQLVVASDGPT
jgi:hypothetical protein